MNNPYTLEPDPHAGRVSDNAIKALQLRTQPFVAEPADGDWFTDDTTREQLLEIKEALINGDDLLLVCGVHNSGKSVLLKQLASGSGSRIQCFSVRGSEKFSTHNLFSGMLEAFKLTPPDDLADILNEAIPCLQALSERNTLGVIVLDDADHVPANELSQLLGCMQYLNNGNDSLLRVLLAAKPEFENQIPELLPTESDLPYAALTMEPLTAGRAEDYLGFRLNQAGHFEEFPFTDRQMHSINENAQGLPGFLNTAAAAEINALYGQPGPIASQTVTQSSFLDNKFSKALIGITAVVMIVAGLFMFLPAMEDAPDANKYSVVAEKPVTAIPTDRIKLVQEPNSDSTSTTDSAARDATDASKTADTVTAETDTSTVAETSSDNETIAPTIATQSAPTTDTMTTSGASSANSSSVSIPDTASNANANESGDNPEDKKQTEPDGSSSSASAEKATTTAAADQKNDTATEKTAPEKTTVEKTTAEKTTAENKSDTNDQTAERDTVSELESANWVLVQDNSKYTVQLVSSVDRTSVTDFMKRHKLGSPSSIFSYQIDGRTKYAMVHGLYDTLTEARAAIAAMPQSAKNNKPWIRRLGQIQESLKKQ